jgi:hypothetical protein
MGLTEAARMEDGEEIWVILLILTCGKVFLKSSMLSFSRPFTPSNGYQLNY